MPCLTLAAHLLIAITLVRPDIGLTWPDVVGGVRKVSIVCLSASTEPQRYPCAGKKRARMPRHGPGSPNWHPISLQRGGYRDQAYVNGRA